MRVSGRLRREESGAVVLLVALGLTFLIGLLALTADLGRMIGIRREMVRAADAAALAAAQQCALGNKSVAARTAAVELAQANRAGTSVEDFTADAACDGATSAGQKLVTVRVSTTVDLFFAPIFGIDQRPVAAEATATWTVPGIVPITVNSVPLVDCDEGETCIIEYPKDELSNPRWGILDLTLWGNEDVTRCPVPNSEIVDIIEQGGIPRPDVMPAFDCLDNGAQFDSWATLEGGTWWFPVINVAASRGESWPGQGAPCTGGGIPILQAQGKDCRITLAYVIDFVRLRVIDVRILPGTGGTIELETERVEWKGSSAGIEIRLVD